MHKSALWVRHMLVLTTLTGSLLLLALCCGVEVAQACENEPLRTGRSSVLPDCRAYELVTPVPDAGQQPVIFEAFGSDSDSLVFSSLGAVGDVGDNPSANGAAYLDTRDTSGGWDAQPLSPAASELEEEGELTPPIQDFSEGRALLFNVAPVGSAPADGRIFLASPTALEEVGPLLPKHAIETWVTSEGQELKQLLYLGASSGFAHIFFTDKYEDGLLVNPYWPGDKTVSGPSLYEYEPAAGATEPRLVGLSTNGSQITQCGTYLGGAVAGGGGSGQVVEAVDAYDAISQDGSRVFFTAAAGGCEGPSDVFAGQTGTGPVVTELYVRIDHSQTVKISEPSVPTDCSECKETEPKPAIFQGASEDGSEVYFLSEQELLPGAKGQTLYKYDFNAPSGERVTLIAPEVLGVARVARQGRKVYYISAAVMGGDGARGAIDTKATSGEPNLYLTEGDDTTYVTTLADVDEKDWRVEDNRTVEATPSGRFLLFNSRNDLTRDAKGAESQLYLYEAPSEADSTGRLRRISIGMGGFNEDGNTPLDSASLAGVVNKGRSYSKLSSAARVPASVIEDGEQVFFQSPAALTPEALNGECAFYNGEGECEAFAENVYEWERPGGQSCPESNEQGCLFLISDGRDRASSGGESDVELVGATPSGQDVFFDTSDPLVSEDVDTQDSVYDAREDGGVSPRPLGESCAGEGCQGISAPPGFASPASTAVGTSGNLTSPNVTSPPTVAKPKPPTRAQELAKALQTCR